LETKKTLTPIPHCAINHNNENSKRIRLNIMATHPIGRNKTRTVCMPQELMFTAEKRAQELECSFSAYVRQCIKGDLKGQAIASTRTRAEAQALGDERWVLNLLQLGLKQALKHGHSMNES
jgi:hypothetical protein